MTFVNANTPSPAVDKTEVFSACREFIQRRVLFFCLFFFFFFLPAETSAASLWDKYTVFLDSGKDSSGHACVQDSVFFAGSAQSAVSTFLQMALSSAIISTLLNDPRRYHVSPFPPILTQFFSQLIPSDGKLHETGENCGGDPKFFNSLMERVVPCQYPQLAHYDKQQMLQPFFFKLCQVCCLPDSSAPEATLFCLIYLLLLLVFVPAIFLSSQAILIGC